MDREPEFPTGTLYQAYLPSFAPGGFAGLVGRMRYFLTLGVDAVVTSPANSYRRGSLDGPYSPLDHVAVDADYGGQAQLADANAAFRRAGINPVGDLVSCHADEQSEIVQRALRDPERWGDWLRVTDDPQRDGWERLENIFDLDPMRACPELGGWRATPFYEDQWALNADNPAVIEYLCDVAETMVRDWGYTGLRLDAIGHFAGIRAVVFMYNDGRATRNPADPAALAVARAIQRRLSGLRLPNGRRPFTLAEGSGTQADTAQWLDGACDLAYDFTWLPALLQCLDTADWTPLRELWAKQPPVKGMFVRYLGSHDQRDFRYSEYCDELLRAHGGRDGQFICYGNTGVTRRVRDLVVGDPAMVLLEGLTILADGVPLIFQGDAEAYGGARPLSLLEPRDQNRSLVPWDATLPRAGWPDQAPYQLEPTWRQRAVQNQLDDPSSPLRRVLQYTTLRSESHAVQWGALIEIPVAPAEERRRVLAFARVTDDGEVVIVVANASTYVQTVDLDLSKWPNLLLKRLITDPRQYSPGSPTLLWEEVYSWGAFHELRVHLGAHDLVVFRTR